MKNAIAVFLAMFVCGCIGPTLPEPVPIEQCDAVSYPPTEPNSAVLHTDGQYFKDAFGRVIMMRGINTATLAKVPDFMPIKDQAVLDPLPEWGFNVLRLLFNWEAFEGTRCAFDETYLSYFEQVVAWAAARGMYVIVDFHQDAYSRYALQGCGEGFPEWAVSSAIEKSIPDNGPACESWGVTMAFDNNNKVLFDHFLSDREGVRSAYLDMLEAVAHRMSEHSNVIGYDIINEPWGSDEQLKSFFEDASVRLRQHHPEAIMFVPSFALVSGGAAANTMAKPNISNFAYAPHYYDPFVHTFKQYQGNDVGIQLNKYLQKSADWGGVPVFLGEFGAPQATVGLDAYMDAIYDWLDAGLISSAQWDYSPAWNSVDKDGWNVEDFSIVDDTGLRGTYTPRPYPQQTSGTPVAFSVDANGFSYTWNNAPAAGDAGKTQFYIPQDYANGKVLSVLSTSGTDCSIAGLAVSCQIIDAGAVTVTLAVP